MSLAQELLKGAAVRAKYLILGLASAAILYPVTIMVLESFDIDLGWIFAYDPSHPPPTYLNPTLRIYELALGWRGFPWLMWNSSLVALFTIAISMLVGVPAGYGFSRFRFRGRDSLGFAVFALRMIPPFAVLVPFYIVYNRVGLYDTHLGLSLTYVVLNLPIVVWLMRGFFSDIPRDLQDAAEVDGCTSWQLLKEIAVPLVVPGLVSTALLVFFLCWNEYLFALILTGAVKTISRGIWEGMSEAEETAIPYVADWDEIAVGGTLGIIPSLILALVIKRYLVRGLTLSVAR